MNNDNGVKRTGPVAWMAANPVAANLLLVIVAVTGLFAIQTLDKEVFPTFPTETFTVTVPYPGSSPEEVERGIILRIEEAVRDIIGIKEIRSEARESVGIVTVLMEPGSDMAKAVNLAKVRVDGISSFPRDAEEPIVEEVESTSRAMRVSLAGDIDPTKLKELGEQVREEILALGDISEIDVSGERDYEISIELSDEKLRRYNLTFDDVVRIIQQQSQDLPGGQLRTDGGSISLRSSSQAYVGRDFSQMTLISRTDGTSLRLGDIADIRDGFTDQPVLSLINGEPGLTFVIDRVGDQNVLDITRRLREYVAEKQLQLPQGVNIEAWGDASRVLRGRINLMLRNAAQGAVLVIIALALFLDLALAFWVVIGLPFAVLGCLATIQLLGLPVSINVLSVFGFILVLGLLVDDAIVTAESVYSSIERGGSGLDSVIGGVHRVATATIFGALTTAVAFGPSLFLTEGFARILSQLGWVVILCVLFSLVETKLVLPAHLRHIKLHKEQKNPGRIKQWQNGIAQTMIAVAQGPYRRLLSLAVGNRYTTVALFLAGLIICLSLIPSGILRVTFFPSVPSDFISISLEMPQGTPWQKTHRYAREISDAAGVMNERFRDQDPEGRDVIKTLAVLSESDTSASIEIELIVSEERDIDSGELGQWLRDALGRLEGVRSFQLNAAAGPGGTPIDIQLSGRDLEQLRQAASELKLQLAQITGVRDIRDSFNAGGRELDIKVTNEGEALGLSDVELARQVRQAFFGAEVQRVQRGRDEVRVYVRLPEEDRSQVETLNSLWINLPDGRRVPFSVVGNAREQSGLSVINRIDLSRVVNVRADIDKTLTASSEVMRLVESSLLPEILSRHPSVRYEVAGEVEEQRDTSKGLLYGGILVLLLIYAALAIPLKSYIEPLLIMSVIPFGVTGAFLGHLILGMDVSILSAIGIIGLVGVVVNDSLVMVDFINHYIDEGHDWKSAVLEAGPTRFRAVILTSLTTFIGLLPIQLETSIQAQFVKPMATSVAFGIFFSTAVTLFLVPTLYYVAQDIRKAFVFARRHSDDPRPGSDASGQ
ncbi:RND family efflux transporter [Luminiphilus syltensis NOR5-1B]|uniref:RND family efflux transporter n=1 Tax=Luminiphilus syltensis NOR5-1B TaxID=565045 RepID=B8KW80_9GAMM|nr:efflux RND transporter permease subunit [Luminiphilus syltensis]EED34595.1 RND family efflux transporter [Luminiphilus syltensis NOR5-1B]